MVNPCRCGSTNLRPEWDSEAGVGWVHCDDCGNGYQATAPLGDQRAIVAAWNKLNEKGAHDGD